MKQLSVRIQQPCYIFCYTNHPLRILHRPFIYISHFIMLGDRARLRTLRLDEPGHEVEAVSIRLKINEVDLPTFYALWHRAQQPVVQRDAYDAHLLRRVHCGDCNLLIPV